MRLEVVHALAQVLKIDVDQATERDIMKFFKASMSIEPYGTPGLRIENRLLIRLGIDSEYRVFLSTEAIERCKRKRPPSGQDLRSFKTSRVIFGMIDPRRG